MLKLEGVCKAWQGFALKDINLEVGQGEYFVLLGPTGAGKTLLLETIAGFHKIDRGKILFGGQDISAVPPEGREFGYVPQNYLLFPNMTVRKNVDFGLKMRRQTEADRKSKVDETLALFGLEPLADRMPATLSAGEKQKVALARVLVIKPRLILLDEPLSSIDADARRGFKDELKRVHQELQVTVIHVTHDQMEGFSLAERVAIIRNGQVIQVGDPKQVMDNPTDESTARLLGYENVYTAKLTQRNGDMSVVSVGRFIMKVSGIVKNEMCSIGVRPEDIIVSLEPPTSDKLNVAKGVVVDYADLGPIVTVDVDAGLLVKAVVAKRQYIEMRLDQSDEVWLSFAPELVKILGYPPSKQGL
jgi:ABC-type Fe3+/spermidine/putrescine transport system ATPase subunit